MNAKIHKIIQKYAKFTPAGHRAENVCLAAVQLKHSYITDMKQRSAIFIKIDILTIKERFFTKLK